MRTKSNTKRTKGTAESIRTNVLKTSLARSSRMTTEKQTATKIATKTTHSTSIGIFTTELCADLYAGATLVVKSLNAFAGIPFAVDH